MTVAVLAVVVLAGALHWFLPFLREAQPVTTSTPSLTGVFAQNDVELKPRALLCVAPIPFDPASRTLRLNVTAHRQAAPLAVSATAPGYHATTRMSGYPLGGGVAVGAPLAPPGRETTGRLCVRNRGRTPVGLTGTQEPRSLVFAQTTLNGRPLPSQSVAVTFFAARPASLASRAGTVFAHASAFTGGWLPTWLLWPLAALFVLGTPLLAAGAFLLAPTEDR